MRSGPDPAALPGGGGRRRALGRRPGRREHRLDPGEPLPSPQCVAVLAWAADRPAGGLVRPHLGDLGLHAPDGRLNTMAAQATSPAEGRWAAYRHLLRALELGLPRRGAVG